MSTATIAPKAQLTSQQRAWLKVVAAALKVLLQGGTLDGAPQTSTPGTPEERTQDVAKRQAAAVETATKEWEALVREKGSSNRGDRIDVYAKNAGFNPNTDQNSKVEGDQGIEWCGAFVGYALGQSGFKDAPSLASYQKARDYFLYRSYTGRISNEKLDQVRADQQATGSSREYFLLDESDSDTAKVVKKKGPYGSEKYGHFNSAKNTFDYKTLPIQPGDVALFKHGHVGMVQSYDPATGILETVEGNTGGDRADGTKASANAVVKKKYDLTKDPDRKKFDGFGRPASGDFQTCAKPSDPAKGGGSGGSTTPPAKPSSGKRTVPGGGGYIYEQHSNGKIFIVQSPRRGKTYFEVKERKPYEAILAEIGPLPTSLDAPGATKPSTGGGSASGILDDVIDAIQDAPGQVGKVVKGIADVIGEELGKVAKQQSAAPASTPQATANPMPISGSDSYRSQTDNPELAGGTCNVTTMAMQLLSLADGDEDKLREEAVQLLKERSVRAKSDTQLEELLRKLTIAVAGGRQVELKNKKGDATYHNSWEVAWVLDKTSELFTGVAKTETVYPGATRKGFQDKIVPAVDKHAAVMLANYLTSAGHIVKLHSVRTDGVVIDDPNGCVLESQGAYLRNGGTVNAAIAKRIKDHAKLLDERLKENPKLRKELYELATAGKGKFPPNTGKQNFYSWAEVGTYKIGTWANVTYKK